MTHPTKITFFEWLTPLITSGKKTITIRNDAEKNYVPHTLVDVYTLETDTYVCQIKIKSVEKIHYDGINAYHAEQEFIPLDKLKALIKEIYPSDDVFYVITYELVK